MTNPDYFKTIKASKKQVGGNHYKDLTISPSEYIYKNNIDWYAGNVIKYVSRYKNKNSDINKQIEDLNKAVHYLQLLIEQIAKN